MSDPRIAAFLVRCTESLLLCEDIPTDTLRFRDMPDCTSQLPALIQRANRRHFGQVVMGRCHYVVGRHGAEQASRSPRLADDAQSRLALSLHEPPPYSGSWLAHRDSGDEATVRFHIPLHSPGVEGQDPTAERQPAPTRE